MSIPKNYPMNRDFMLNKLSQNETGVWDFAVVGGGATGLGVAVDAVSRGYKTVLVEASDFSKGTSSRSTKLIHGGVRYLQNGEIPLVLEALRERGRLKQNAPHLVHDMEFVIPAYNWWSGLFYTIGLKVYDILAGKLSLGKSIRISKNDTLKNIPNLIEDRLNGGVVYHDGQFDDARLAINLAQTCAEKGGVVLNYMKVLGLIKSQQNRIVGVRTHDVIHNKEYIIKAKCVINATGVFVDDILKLDNPNSKPIVKSSQGVHIVLDRSFLQGNKAIMIPKTEDGRVLFAVPWHDKVVVGTTDTEINTVSLEPRALESEIDFILRTASLYLRKVPTRKDIKSAFAGLRPLAAPQKEGKSTKEISRGCKFIISQSGLLTIIGGKWTIYRQMGEDAVDKAISIAGIQASKCVTQSMRIHGYSVEGNRNDPYYYYGSDKGEIAKLITANPELGERLHPDFPFIKAQVVWAVFHEMAQSIEDVLARRLRALFLDASASIEMAQATGEILVDLLKKDECWLHAQINEYSELAKGYYYE